MLKIKDEVNMKELEKYGFKYEQSYFSKKYYTNDDGDIAIDIDTREICVDSFDFYNEDLLYDIIIAGLVEKRKGE